MKYNQDIDKSLVWDAAEEVKQRAYALASQKVGPPILDPDYVQTRMLVGGLLVGLPLLVLGPLAIVGMIVGGAIGGFWAHATKSRREFEWEEAYRYYLSVCHDERVERGAQDGEA